MNKRKIYIQKRIAIQEKISHEYICIKIDIENNNVKAENDSN